MRRCGAAALAAIGALTGAWAARADRPEPVPLYGAYDTYLDHARQTFEGRPDPSAPSTQAASFTTTCTAQGCVAHWLRVAELSDNPHAPALFDYRWNGDRWESSADYPFHCGAGGTVTAARSDFLIPNGDGSFSGERTFTVGGAGLPGGRSGHLLAALHAHADELRRLLSPIWSVRPGHLHLTGCLGLSCSRPVGKCFQMDLIALLMHDP